MFDRVREVILILGILALSAQGMLHSARVIETESATARGVVQQERR